MRVLWVDKYNRALMVCGNATLLMTPYSQHNLKKLAENNQNQTILDNGFFKESMLPILSHAKKPS